MSNIFLLDSAGLVVKVKVKVAQLCLTLCNPMHGLHSPWNSPGQNTGVGSLSLLQGIFLTQGSNLGFLHCRQILYQLSHKGNPGHGLVEIKYLTVNLPYLFGCSIHTSR